MTETCVRCQRPMRRTVGLVPTGFVRHVALGHCETCYRWLRKKRRPWKPKYIRSTRAYRRPTGSNVDLDDAVVDRLLAGDLAVPYTTAELAAAIRTLDGVGASAQQIAVRLGVTTRSVQRHRTKRGVFVEQ